MEKKGYKIENLPKIWWCKVSNGCYSNYSEDNYFFNCDSPAEAFEFLAEYLRETEGNVGTSSSKMLLWGKEEALIYGQKEEGEYGTSDSSYGTGYDCEISMLPVIFLSKLNKKKSEKNKEANKKV